MSQKPRILIVNDDGIYAPGLKTLWKAVDGKADVAIVAPAFEKSGAGMSLTLRKPLIVETVPWEKNTPAWKIAGTPADCVRLAVSIVLDYSPDLIISGINRGSNAGRNILYSGTVGGIMEGVLRNIPGIAFSCEDFENPQYHLAERYIMPLINHVLEHPMPKGTFLNVSFPVAKEYKGIKMARQGMGYWKESPDQRLHPDGHFYYWMGGKWHHHEEHNDSDVALLKDGYVTAVPIHINEMTDRAVIDSRRTHFEEAMKSIH